MHPFSKIAIDLHDAFVSDLKPNTSVFLIGKAKANKESMRYKLRLALKSSGPIKAYLPEILFDEVLYSQKVNFLQMENILAKSVDAVIIFPESAGSLVELGAFSNHESLNQKLIVIQDSSFKKKRSFINQGPLRYLKDHTNSKVLWHDYNSLDFDGLVSKINRHIKEINSTSINSLKNISIMEQFILILFYILGEIPEKDAYRIFDEILTHTEAREFLPIAYALMNYHIKNGNLKKSTNCYDITQEGIKLLFVLNKSFKPNRFDSFRIKVLNNKSRKRIKFGEQIAVS